MVMFKDSEAKKARERKTHLTFPGRIETFKIATGRSGIRY